MITAEIKQALSGYFGSMQKPVTLALQTGEHEKRAEQAGFLADIIGISEYVNFEERHAGLRSPVIFSLEVDGQPTGIVFSGIPSGHEFNSLILAILHASGSDMKLDGSVRNLVRQVSKPLRFEVFISLSCHNCPDVVQALNQFALLNPNISSELLDGSLFPKLSEQRDIQGVPTVYLNGELFANGKMDAAPEQDQVGPAAAQSLFELVLPVITSRCLPRPTRHRRPPPCRDGTRRFTIKAREAQEDGAPLALGGHRLVHSCL
jgi:alkyl hydroperoxide reductase subunit F